MGRGQRHERPNYISASTLQVGSIYFIYNRNNYICLATKGMFKEVNLSSDLWGIT